MTHAWTVEAVPPGMNAAPRRWGETACGTGAGWGGVGGRRKEGRDMVAGVDAEMLGVACVKRG
jgi:hypothetical protein